jgi:GLPGLI family protein
MLPKERQSFKMLTYNKDNALYIKDDTAEDGGDIALQSGGGMAHFRMYEPDNKMFTDMKNRVQIEQREFMNRMFLIESDMTLAPWKLTGNEREILGYLCQEAVMEKDSVKTVAWFTPTIPLPIGPATYNNLPGVVLAVDINDGRHTITATRITADQPNKIAKPKDGKKVTEDGFKKIVDEKMKEMGVEQGGAVHGERVMIRITR